MRTIVQRSLPAILAFAMVLAGCSSTQPAATQKQETYEDAVRIQPSVTSKYFRTDETGVARDGRTLRGVVERVVIRLDSANNAIDTSIVFRDLIDTSLSRKPLVIPIADVETISHIFPSVKTGEYGGINVFESFNVTKQIPVLRQVPVDSLRPNEENSTKKDCNCEQFNLSADLGVRIHCYDRDYSSFFASVLGRASAYTDGSSIISTGRLNFGADLIAGWRFGDDKRWMLGLTYSTGIATVNAGNIIPSVTIIDTMVTEMRPLLLLTGRHYFTSLTKKKSNSSSSYLKFDVSTDPNKPAAVESAPATNESWVEAVFGCIKPYTYGELGAALDTKTQAALSMSLSGPECSECVARLMKAKANGDINVDWSLPISYGLGVGIDIPVSQKLDIEVDLGYRSVAVGDAYSLLGFTNVPDTRRIGSFQLRLGVTY